jgi:hypothetical protein
MMRSHITINMGAGIRLIAVLGIAVICLPISQVQGAYCSASSSNCNYEHISNVQVGTINNNTGNTCSGYSDYTSMSTTMVIGGSYPITVTNGTPYSDDQCGIWIDWNGDEDFYDAGETITVTGSPGLGPYTATITPPVGAVNGNIRMRIRITWTGTVSPCGTTDWGEVEDYTINVDATKMLLGPVADSYVSWEYPTTNYGTETKLRVGKKASARYVIYIKFDLSSIPPGQAIFSAKLHLYAYEVSSTAPSVVPALVTDDSWQETEITADNAPSSFTENAPAVYINLGDNVWNVGVHVDRSYLTDGIYSVNLGYLTSGATEYYAHFGSREHSTPSYRPYLEIEYGEPFCGGTGTADDPYRICTGEQMNNIGRLQYRWDRYYKLMNDISMAGYSGSSYNVIGNSSPYTAPRTPFRGSFDGNNHSISDFSYYATNSFNDDYIGLFGYVYNGTIKNLKLISPNVSTHSYTQRYVGPIAGVIFETDVLGCSVIGGTSDGENYIGGLVGISTGGHIADCISSASVSGGNNVGGLVGGGSILGALSSITNSYARGAVSGDDYVGGFVGDSSDMMIANCYSSGPVSGTSNAGGFSGYNVNELFDGNNVIGCFWDVDSSGKSNSAAGTGLSTVEMYNQNTFTEADWDFVDETDNGGSDDWSMPAGGGYPVLWYELPAAPNLPTFPGGSGTAENPYLIETEEQLSSIGHNPRLMDKHFKLVNDLDMEGVKYYMIADRPYAFSGTFNGAGHTIRKISPEPSLGTSCMGLIGSLDGNEACIKDLTLIEPNVVSAWGWGVGSLTGINEHGTISNCHAVNVKVDGMLAVGGLVGSNQYGSIRESSATGEVSENTFMSVIYSAVGGLAGENSFYSEIENSYAKCDVSGDDCVGGLIGSNLAYSTITNCYSQGNVLGTKDYIGGLIGRNQGGTETDYCYSGTQVTGPAGTNAVGGFVGKMGTTGKEYYKACFWDSEVNPDVNGIGNGSDANVIGESTANMQISITFTDAGWDFVGETINGPNDIWDICEGTNYPKLACQIPLAGDFVCPDGVEINDLVVLHEEWQLEEIPADVWPDDGDGIVNFFDWAVFANQWEITISYEGLVSFADQWLKTGVIYCIADIAPAGGGDGIVNMPDFAVFANNWLEGL